MSILSLVLLAIIISAVLISIPFFRERNNHSDKLIRINNYIKSLSLFALIFGILGQLIGLFSAFSAVKIGSVEASPAMMMKGFEVSMISSIYGALIFILGIILHGYFRRFRNLA
ncbi:MotA/TolQ/ExbB proton channel family protein [Gramella sp. MT6]|uniref:MotA/TolQ/ExbB proton channel family protein n=1 Tax=Gramella sp. MT6 TaxID=2705471 RepID=UPI001C5D32DC|nr:MotA/TolQ/ExbB proton channel family protein [Gramella sp. MT6]QYA26155.1 MotA/TolQ/ExbB proton channel family protein [Gramella sp. MT6]